jgi:phosphatidylserine/phosphatidylglycerophosphate/cardiolipin synthase-like enzyme
VTGDVSSIAAIPLIGVIPPFPAIPPFVQPSTAIGGFRVTDLPPPVQQELNKGAKAWREAARAAIAAGITDPVKIADIIFFTQHKDDRIAGDVGKLIERSEPQFMKLRAEWEHDLAIANRFLSPGFIPDVFLPEQRSSKYEEFVTPKTTGKVTMMVNGRSFEGTGADKFRDAADFYDRMQQVVDTLGNGDTLYFASWQFIPWGVSIPANASSFARTWQHLLAEKANAGVKIRVIITHQPPGSDFVTNTDHVDVMINALPENRRDNFKYIFVPHADPRGTHHQKFMVARKGKSTVAFCGGLDLSANRIPQRWLPADNFVWHDVCAKLEGLIAHDLERQFVEHWNRDRTKSTTASLAGWRPFEKLTVGSASGEDKAGALNGHAVQMLRTVSLGPEPHLTQRDDIWRGYHRVIARARRFLYLENQYFHQPELADAIVRQVQSSPGMIVIVAVGTGTDDRQAVDPKAVGLDLIKQQAMVDATQNGFALRLEFFKRLQPLFPTFLRVYTVHYPGGTIHSKFVLCDDEVLSVGSANANPRGFIFDTEVNVVLEHPETVRAFRHQLWAHNLGLPVAEVANWNLGDFFPGWNAVAHRNLGLEKMPEAMVGERVIPFEPWNPKDPRFRAGRRGPIRVGPLQADAPEGLF